MKWAMYKKSPQLPLIVSRRNMAQTNLTDDENQKPLRELWCSAEFIRGVDCELIFLSAVNIFLSITAFLGNTLILVALHKETSLHPPSKLLYRNLAITDLCVGITGQPWMWLIGFLWWRKDGIRIFAIITDFGDHVSQVILCVQCLY